LQLSCNIPSATDVGDIGDIGDTKTDFVHPADDNKSQIGSPTSLISLTIEEREAGLGLEDSSTNTITTQQVELEEGQQQHIPNSIYRVYGDTWACKNQGCNTKGDKWFMLTHPRYCKGGNPLKQNAEVKE
jgi:hypothetical protein